jgi:hypothetical protein
MIESGRNAGKPERGSGVEREVIMNQLSEAKLAKFLIRLAFICFVIFAGYEIYSKMIVNTGGLGYDDAFHSLRGLLIYDDLHHGDLLSVLYDSYRQVYYPPLPSLLLGIMFLILPPNTTSAILFSLILFLSSSIVIYFAARELDASDGEWIAIIASLLWLTSPALIEYAARPMLEIPGLFALVLTLLVYFRLTQKPESLKLNFLFGLGMVITYFMKSNYGILLMIVSLVAFLIDEKFRLKGLLKRRYFTYALPLIVTFVVWFAYPPKITSTWSAMVNSAYGVKDTFSLAGLLFYPKALVQISGSAWLFGIYLLCFVISIKFLQDQKIRYLLLLIAAQMIIGEFHQTKVARHIFTVLPAFFLLTGYVAARWWNWKLFANRLLDDWLPRSATLAALLFSVSLFFKSLNPVGTGVPRQFLDAIATTSLQDDSTLIVSTVGMGGVNPPSLDWQLITDYHVMDASHSGIAMNLVWDEKAAAIMSRFNAIPQLRDLVLPVFRRADEAGQPRTLCIGQPPDAPYSLTQADLRKYLLSLRQKWAFDHVIVITSTRSKAAYPPEFIAPALKELGFSISSTKDYPGINNRVEQYTFQP